MTTRDLANYVGQSPRWGYRHSDILPGIRLGKEWRFRKEDIDEFLDALKREYPKEQDP